ncbi:hypothetical protein QUC26_09345 [Pseudomonas asiatica]|uniref:hypothetical protein n=1 Tax=Pseudomonas asiatica TaxID=2219225 RepID=UPI00259FF062|nr:hypothetical protein [Pseudomonas asiatica]WJM55333.1 hypothetical protein QUC26_09345 [Pseudomonas asiatica]
MSNTETTLTRTHIAYFTEFVENLFRMALTEVADNSVNVDATLAFIDFKEYGKRFGEEVFKHCSYADLKYADKVLSDERVLRASYALEQAILHVSPSLDENTSFEVNAHLLTSGAFNPVAMTDAIADASEGVQERAIEILVDRQTTDGTKE